MPKEEASTTQCGSEPTHGYLPFTITCSWCRMSESNFASNINADDGVLIVAVDFTKERVIVNFSDGSSIVYSKKLLFAHRMDPGTETLIDDASPDGWE
jgi:hypothetical protein